MRTFQPSPWDDPSPLFTAEHRALARKLESDASLERDADLHDAARVGRRLGELGLYQHLANARALSLCVVREALAYLSPLADAVFAVQGLCMNPLVRVGRRDVVDAMVKGERIGGFALTEPEAGSDVAAMKTRAAREGDHWVLDGEKTLISNVGIAHHFVVFANADPAGDKKGISAFLVPADAPGVELSRIALSGDHPLGRVVLASCKLPKEALLGDVGQGLSLALGTLGVYRTTVGAAALGMAWRALEETIVHVKRRVQFGKKLADLQLVQAALADMTTELCAARLLVANAAWHNDSEVRGEAAADGPKGTSPDASLSADVRRRELGRLASMAKMSATESAQRIIDRAVQLHGGMGVALGTKVEELYREIRPLRIYEGATDVLKLVVAQSVLARASS